MIKQKNAVFILIVTLVIIGAIFYPVIFSLKLLGGESFDILSYYYPLKFHAVTSVQSGRIPLWNPYIFSGIPFQANMQTGIFYPLHVLSYIMPFNTGFSFFYIIHFMLAFLGMYLLIRDNMSDTVSGLIGALVYAFSGYMLVRIPQGHIVHHAGYSLIPLCTLLFTRMCRGGFTQGILFSLSLAMVLLSGHIQPFIMLVLFLTAYVLSRLPAVKILPIVISSVPVLIAAIQLFPTGEYALYTSRSLWDYRIASSYSLSLKSFITMIFPLWFGSPMDNNFIVPQSASLYYELYALYIGIIPILLSLVGLWRDVAFKKYFLLLSLIVFFVISLGAYTPIYYFMYKWLPGISLIRAPGRFYVIVLLIISVLSAKGYFYIKKTWKIPAYVNVSVVMAVILCLFIPYKKCISGQKLHDYARRTKSADYIEYAAWDYRICTSEDISNPNKSMLYRQYNINGYEALFLKNYVYYINASQEGPVFTTTTAQISDYQSSLLKALGLKIFVTKEGYIKQKEFIPQRHFIARRLLPARNDDEVINILCGKDFQSGDDVVVSIDELNRKKQSISGSLIKDESKGYVMNICNYYPEMVIVNTIIQKPSWLVNSDADYPGWFAYTDRKKSPVYTCNLIMKGVFIEKEGRHTTYWIFRPLSFRIGLIITVLIIIFLLTFAQIIIIKTEISG